MHIDTVESEDYKVITLKAQVNFLNEDNQVLVKRLKKKGKNWFWIGFVAGILFVYAVAFAVTWLIG